MNNTYDRLISIISQKTVVGDNAIKATKLLLEIEKKL